jgi:addiction module RelE/StbE family toxin
LANQSHSRIYQIIYGKDFLKDLKNIIEGGNKRIKNKVNEIVLELKSDPHRKRPKVDLKLISSKSEAVYRVRLGKYRLIYQIEEKEKKINITMIFPRGRGYQSILNLLRYNR